MKVNLNRGPGFDPIVGSRAMPETHFYDYNLFDTTIILPSQVLFAGVPGVFSLGSHAFVHLLIGQSHTS